MRTNKELSTVRGMQPIPFGENFQDEIQMIEGSTKNSPLEDESYIMEFCRRLPYSFKASLETGLTSHDFAEKLREQKRLLSKQKAEFLCSATDAVNSLSAKYVILKSGKGNDNTENTDSFQKTKKSFLGDTPEIGPVIKNIRPILLLEYLTDSLLRNIEGSNEKIIFTPLEAIYCRQAAIDKEDLLLESPIDFRLIPIHLFHGYWKAKVYDDVISLDVSSEKHHQEKFPMVMMPLLETLTNY